MASDAARSQYSAAIRPNFRTISASNSGQQTTEDQRRRLYKTRRRSSVLFHSSNFRQDRVKPRTHCSRASGRTGAGTYWCRHGVETNEATAAAAAAGGRRHDIARPLVVSRQTGTGSISWRHADYPNAPKDNAFNDEESLSVVRSRSMCICIKCRHLYNMQARQHLLSVVVASFFICTQSKFASSSM